MSKSSTLYNMAKAKHASIATYLGELNNVIQNMRNENVRLEREVNQLKSTSLTNRKLEELHETIDRLQGFMKLKDRAKMKIEERERQLKAQNERFVQRIHWYENEVQRLKAVVGNERLGNKAHIPMTRDELSSSLTKLVGVRQERDNYKFLYEEAKNIVEAQQREIAQFVREKSASEEAFEWGDKVEYWNFYDEKWVPAMYISRSDSHHRVLREKATQSQVVERVRKAS